METVVPDAVVEGVSETRKLARVRKLKGQVRVPADADEAAAALWLAAIAAGDSRVDGVPPGAEAVLTMLRQLGVDVDREGAGAIVKGKGLRGLQAPAEALDMSAYPYSAQLVTALLSQQSFPCELWVAEASCKDLVQLLARTGAVATELAPGRLQFEGMNSSPVSADHPEKDLAIGVRQALLLAGLFGDGMTTVRERSTARERADAPLRQRGITPDVSRKEDPAVRNVTLPSGGELLATDVDLPGDVLLALPLIVAAVCLPRSDLSVTRLSVRSDNRVMLDLLRQAGAGLDLEDQSDGTTSVQVKGTVNLKPTRVAEQRAVKLLAQTPLLAVLATQTHGEFIIRDVESLREGEFDLLSHLVASLRSLEAKVGEYPEGIVIEGGRPLKGATLDCRNNAHVAQAFAVLGLLAHGETELLGPDAAELTFPGYFDVLTQITG
ncbi:MAG: hypothetical protein VX733_04710 [Candidatus Latescibacterota bacterium]|nr:hypothetical protein [Candidatus Latescibacterota bacterium]